MNTETRSVSVHAINGSTIGDETDFKSIPVPEGYRYVSHSTSIWTANPQGDGQGRWRIFSDVTRAIKSRRIEDVWVKVVAGPKDTFGARVWIGVKLDVVLEKI